MLNHLAVDHAIEVIKAGRLVVEQALVHDEHRRSLEDGLAGFKKFVSGLPKDTKVNTVRIFADGDYVVAHSEVTLASPQIVFDVFRFENGLIVEHWDNLEAKCPRPNGSGRTQIDGPTEITDRDKTEANKALAKETTA